MATVLEATEDVIVQEIQQGIEDSLPKLDPVFTKIHSTSMGVGREKFGRNWKVIHTFGGGLCGAHSWESVLGDDVTMDGGNGGAGFTVYAASNGWQGLGEMAGPGIHQRTIQLYKGRGNFPVPIDLMRADMNPSTRGQMVAQIIKGFSKRINLAKQLAFWKVASTNSIGTFTADALGTDITTTAQVITLTSGRIRSFYRGLLLDVYDDPATTIVNTSSSPVVGVESVDYLAKTLRIRTVNSSVALTASTSYSLLPHKVGITNAPSGLEDWIKSSGTLFGGTISLTSYPEHRSIVNTGMSGAAENADFNKHFAGFYDGYGEDLDTIIMTEGVMTGWLQNLESTAQLVRYEVQGSALKVEGGFQPFGYQYNGRRYQIMTSPNCPTGTVYALRLNGQNYKKYMPPRLKGAKSDSRVAGELEFVAPLMGSNSIFTRANLSGGGPSEFLIAPCYNFCEFAPTDPCSIKLSGFSEDIYTG